MSHSVLKFIIFSYFIRKESVPDILWVFFNETIIPLPRPGYGILLYWSTRHHYREVSNAPSSGIIVDYCVFNSMQHQMDL